MTNRVIYVGYVVEVAIKLLVYDAVNREFCGFPMDDERDDF